MKYTFIVCVLCVLVAFVFTARSEGDKLTCIHGKFQNDMGRKYSACYTTSKATAVRKVKHCYQEVMKDINVVKVHPNGQMNVTETKFKEYATTNSGTTVGKAMKACHDRQDADMYKEAARASQCVFEEIKKLCK